VTSNGIGHRVTARVGRAATACAAITYLHIMNGAIGAPGGGGAAAWDNAQRKL